MTQLQAAAVASGSREERLYHTIEEAMPNVDYLVDGERRVHMADLYVRGRVVDVEAGRSFSWVEDGDAERRIEHPFNSAESPSSTLHLIVDVDEAIEAEPGATPSPETVKVGLALDTPINLDGVRDEFAKLGDIVFLLYQPSPVYDYDPAVWAVMEDGAFIGVVAPDGTVTFPILSGEGEVLVPRGLSVNDLEQPDASEPIQLVTQQGALTRLE